MSANEYDFEPIRGLPEALPADETILWQGSPNWKTIAVRAMHVRSTAVYFAVLLTWYATSKLDGGASAGDVLLSGLRLAAFALIALSLLTLYAWLSGRSTVYTITNKRVVIRAGVALPKIFNLPYSGIESADLRNYADGSGDIVLGLPSRDRVAYLLLWPHVRPWRFNRAQPMLRAIPEAALTAQILGRAISAQVGESARIVTQADRDVTAPGPRPRAPALA